MAPSTLLQNSNQKTIYSLEDLQDINLNSIPSHVAIIMDGNRRWALNHNLPVQFGYGKGAEKLKEIVQAARQLGIKTLTVYAFSTENWRRSKEEITQILHLLKEYLNTEKEGMIANGICLRTIGSLEIFPKDLIQAFQETQKATEEGKELTLVLALNYGARDEIKRAMQRIALDCTQKKLEIAKINENTIAKYLDTADWGDPELLIRTSGEFRLSNFLLWQLSYTEIFILQTLWPDFSPADLLTAIKNYQKREKRRGI